MSRAADVEKGGVEATSPAQGLHGAHPVYTPRPTRIANSGTLGLFSFASTTLMLSLFNLQTRGITHPNVVVGMAIFCGGLAQLLAGMWAFPYGNMFGATAFSSYGAFWMSYATILIPGSGIGAAFAESPEELSSALGIYLIVWFMVTFFFFIAALRKNWGFIFLLGFLSITFILLGAGEFTGSAGTTKAGGAIGCITAMIAYYVGLSELLDGEAMAVARLPIGVFPKRD